jgi:tetratricopeptide (TPR) repeat protein
VQFGGPDNRSHYGRLRDVLGAARRAFLAAVATVGLAAAGAAWNAWVFIPAAVAAVFAIVDAFVVVLGAKAEWAEEWTGLLRRRPCRAGDAEARECHVDRAVLPEGQEWRYVERDFEEELRNAIKGALSAKGPRLVMLSGPTKAGKTRAAFQALDWEELRAAWLLVPRDGASVKGLLEPGRLPRRYKTVVVWLDDIERYASVDASGLHADALSDLKCDRRVLLLATEGGRGQKRLAQNSELAEPVEDLRRIAEHIEVAVKLTDAELSRTEEAFGEDFATEAFQVGLGRRMVAAAEIKRKLTTGRHEPTSEVCLEGVAVMRVAIDWRGMGAQSPLSSEQIDSLYRAYLPDDLDPSEELLETGINWARKRLPDTEISLLPKAIDATNRFEPYDLAVAVGADEWPVIEWQAQQQIISVAEPLDCFQMGLAAYKGTHMELALELWSRAEQSADERLQGASASNLGVLLKERGDLDGAEAAYRRADERGHADGAYNLGLLLAERGDLDGAEAAYRRADERGDAGGASNLGVLLQKERGDMDGAEAAYRRADKRGYADGAYNLGVLLQKERGDMDGAEAAYQRADERGHADGASNLGVLLQERGDLDGAEAAWRRADERGHANGAYNLGLLRAERGDLDGAESAYRRADERGHANGAYNLGLLLAERGDLDGAEATWWRADQRGDARGAYNLGLLLAKRGDPDGAEAAFARARERGFKPGSESS